MASQAASLCRVCRQRTAEYTCPRCNARYCSLDCYRQHSDRCTEGFYRDAAVSELRSISADEDEKRRMMDILQRLHQQELEDGSGGSSSGGDSDGEEEEDGGLSAQTLHRLFAKMEASGGELDVSAEDLTPSELAAFHRALAAGELSGVVQPWEPWWLSEEAAGLELSAAGTALVAAVEEKQQQDVAREHGQQQSSGASSSGPSPASAVAVAPSSLLPPPPSKPLPPLAALTKAAPSPLLQYQLLDVLYSYCLTLRRYNGDYQWEAADAADALFALSSVLAAVAPASSSNSSHGSSSSQPGSSSIDSSGDAASAASVLLGCIQRACLPPIGDSSSRGFAVGVVSDVAAMLQLGRPVVLTALMDTSQLVEAAHKEIEGSGGSTAGGAGGPASRSTSRSKQHKELRRQLVAAQRKLLFMLSWANEQPAEVYDSLALAAATDHEKHAAALAATRTPVTADAAAAVGVPASSAVLIEEL